MLKTDICMHLVCYHECMKSVHIRRHAHKNSDGTLTEVGIAEAQKLAKELEDFKIIVSSPAPRAIHTAKLLTGRSPRTDERANYFMADQKRSDAINELATEKNITFLEALQHFDDPEIHDGIANKAIELNQLIDELLLELEDDEHALIISHDVSISPAMQRRGRPLESINPLKGYRITDAGEIENV